MDVRKILVVLALFASGTAAADIVTKVEAVETSTSNVSVPTAPNGRLMFKPCSGDCDEKFIIVRLTPETVYTVGSQRTDFLGFRRAFFNMRRGKDGYALVAFDVEKSTVTSVTIGE